jgi:hypothetical protein
VLALYRDESNTWRSIEMAPGSRWSGAGPLTGDTVEWYIQAVDATGNVGVTSNKSRGYTITPDEPTGDIEAVVVGNPAQVNGWYTENVEVEISGAPGIRYSLDGAPFQTDTSLTITGTGVHSLDFQGTDGSKGTLDVPIDLSNPTVHVNATYGFAQVAHAVCADSGSGIAACDVPSPLNTGSTGEHTISVHAEDRAGHEYTATATYVVTAYPFTGFFPPIDNLPTFNVVSGGNAVPIKFSLGGFRGMSLFAPGYPSSVPISCAGGELDDVEEIVPPGSSSLTYDPATNQYRYVWQTQRNWRGTCRQLIVRLRDGSEKRANFRFR